MNYTITPGGIVYHVITEEMHEEHETDRIEDAQTPISRDEVMNTIRRVADQFEAWENELLGRS